MNIGLSAFVAAGLLVGAAGVDALPAAALPAISGSVAAGTARAVSVDKAWYRCGYGRCYRRAYGYYRPYRYYGGYGYGYRPHIGIGIGGVGVGFY